MRIDSPTIIGNLSATGTIYTPSLSVLALSSAINYAPLTITGSNSQSLFQSIQNITPGVSASTDISVYNDTGNYLDMGIASSTYNGNLFGPTFNVVGAGDSYLYTTANNLVLGTSLSSNTFTNDIVMFTGGTLSGASGVGNERMRITTGGNVGIGTSTPNSALTVVGAISASGTGSFDYLNINSSVSPYYVFFKDGVRYVQSQSSDHWSFGASGPTISFRAATSVAGTNGGINFGPAASLNWGSDNSRVGANIDLALWRDSSNTLALRNSLNPQAFNIYNTYTSATSAERASLKWVNNTFVIGTETLPTSASNRDMAFQTASSTRMTITSGGLVGIGTSTPNSALTVVGAISASGTGSFDYLNINSSVSPYYVFFKDGVRYVQSQSSDHWSFGASGPTISFRAATSVAGTNGGINFGPAASLNWGSDNSRVGANIDLALWRDSSNTLALRNSLNPQAFNIYNTYTSATSAERASLKWVNNTFVIGTETLPTSASNRDMAFQTASSTRMTITSGGLVGIGTSTPNSALTVVGAISATGTGTMTSTLTNSLSVNGQTKVLAFNIGDGIIGNNFAGTNIWNISRSNTPTNAGLNLAATGGITFSTNPNSPTSTIAMTLSANGYVGIGTTTPNEKLTVVGNISATGVVTHGSYLVANLPAAASYLFGIAGVTNALTPTVGLTVMTGGAAKCLVCSNGTNWIVTALL